MVLLSVIHSSSVHLTLPPYCRHNTKYPTHYLTAPFTCYHPALPSELFLLYVCVRIPLFYFIFFKLTFPTLCLTTFQLRLFHFRLLIHVTSPHFFVCHSSVGTAAHPPSLWLHCSVVLRLAAPSPPPWNWSESRVICTVTQVHGSRPGWSSVENGSSFALTLLAPSQNSLLKHCPSRISSRILSLVLGAGSQRRASCSS